MDPSLDGVSEVTQTQQTLLHLQHNMTTSLKSDSCDQGHPSSTDNEQTTIQLQMFTSSLTG